ncbi:hypothetical protein ACQFN5_09610 [Klebsiella sp. WOUb02]|uniref:hypothetical protein n=1 Tax=Klebsiella sp. WOUb02 TaxID=3161071 RepID=UPI003CF73675
MLIRDRSNMEAAMNLTLRDLVEKRKMVTDAAWKRQEFLQLKAHQLTGEYKESLALTDGDEKVVQTGIIGSDGKFEACRYPQLATSDDHELFFIIRTDLSDSSGDKHWCDTHVKMWKIRDNLHVCVEDASNDIIIIRGEPEGCFSQAVAAIKESIVRTFISAMPG